MGGWETMLDGPLLTAEEFLDRRFELPESGQWAELEAGKVVLFQPPDLDYGNTVLNLSKLLAAYIQEQGPGYACFDLGLQLETAPDTIRFPAACYFLTGPRFAETDLAFTARVPELGIELNSTADRRQVSERRVQDYHRAGSRAVWLIDPAARQLTCVESQENRRTYAETERFEQPDLLPGFRFEIQALFAEPSWWAG